MTNESGRDQVGTKPLSQKEENWGSCWWSKFQKAIKLQVWHLIQTPDTHPSALSSTLCSLQNKILVHSSYLITLQYCIKYEIGLQHHFADIE